MKTDSKPARLAESIFHETLTSVRAETLIANALTYNGKCIRIATRIHEGGHSSAGHPAEEFIPTARSGPHLSEESIPTAQFERVLVLGAGKAASGMAVALEKLLGDRITDGVVVTKYGHSLPTKRIRVIEAGHPTPDENSLKAGQSILSLAESAGKNDLVLFLLSGGASALMESSREGITLDQLRSVTNSLLNAGADITELNTVRACLSKVKAGGIARAAHPATIAVLAISDVLGNSLATIGSGPCFPTTPDVARARQVLQKYHITDAILPEPTSGPIADSEPAPPHYIIGDVWTAVEAAADSARRHGLDPVILTGSLQVEAKDVGKLLGTAARDMPRTGVNCIIAGGETTVTVRGNGLGGRSQELACYAALEIEGIEGVAVLAAGTDGTDGPTDAAGGVVDGSTISKARSAGIGVEAYLADNNSAPLLQATGAQMLTGPTQTNVNDLVICVRG